MLCPTIVSDFENNLILYFFSAMPQVLGTMLALLGAFYPSRSATIRNEIREINNTIQKKINRMLISDEINNSRDRNRDFLRNQFAQGPDKFFADRIYHLGNQELLFLADIKNINDLFFSEYSFNEIKKLYSDFVFHLHQSLATFYDGISKVREENIEFESKYPNLQVSSHLQLQQIGEIKSLMKNSKDNIDLYFKMKQSIKEVFVFNGSVLVLFITSFLFLKYTSNSNLIHNFSLQFQRIL